MNPVLERINQYGILPVVVLEQEKDAAPLAEALVEGGLPAAEITFRTEAAAGAIKKIKEAFPQMLVGAGTIFRCDQVNRAIEAGAEFIVSPGLNTKTVDYCIKQGITMLPGCANASDIELAMEYGLKAVKFFPAEPAGGITMIKALAAPYRDMLYMPTGGINETNMAEYLKFSKVLAVGGSWMVNNSLIEQGNFEEIRKLTGRAVEMVKKVRGGEPWPE